MPCKWNNTRSRASQLFLLEKLDLWPEKVPEGKLPNINEEGGSEEQNEDVLLVAETPRDSWQH
jgi:hypothetical protein